MMCLLQATSDGGAHHLGGTQKFISDQILDCQSQCGISIP
jgi:hypothetical protein